MPGGDGTGPGGMGPMTGRATGYCTGNPVPGSVNPIAGRGFGFGQGRGGGGRGRRNMFYATGLTGWQRTGYAYQAAGSYGQGVPNYSVPFGAPATPTREQELGMLKDQSEHLKGLLEGINKRINELGTGKE